MQQRLTVVERAFAIADLGFSVTEIRRTLSSEGYDQSHLNGPAITKQLLARIAKARSGGDASSYHCSKRLNIQLGDGGTT